MASIRRRGKAWQVLWRDDSRKLMSKQFRRKVDAARFRDELTASVVTGSYVPPRAGRITVGEYATAWLEGRVHLKPKTLADYESLLRTRVLPRWGKVPLDRITHEAVAAWVSSMASEGLSASRTRQAYHLLTGMLDDAVRASRLARNPAAGVDLPRMVAKPKRSLTHEQLADLADAAGNYRTLVLVLGYCGLRWGEAAALRVGRVDPLRGRLEVVEAVTEVNGKTIFGSPKTHEHRSVSIPPFLRDDLAAVMGGKGRDDLVFTSPQGGVLRVGNFRRRVFDPACREVGLEGFTPHELRHTAASLAVDAGANVKAVQHMLGHASAAVTLDRYSHLFGDELDVVADRLGERRADIFVDIPPVGDGLAVAGRG